MKTIYALMCLVVFGMAATPSAAVDYLITFDSSALPNTTAGYIYFQLAAAGTGEQLVQASVSSFSSSNITLGSTINLAGSASGGPLPGTVTMNNNSGNVSNSAYQDATFGTNSSLNFYLSLTGPGLTTSATVDTSFRFELVDTGFTGFTPSLFFEITIPKEGTGLLSISKSPTVTAITVPEPGTWMASIFSVIAILLLKLTKEKARNNFRFLGD